MSKRDSSYDGAAGGWDALASVARALGREGQPVQGARTLLRANQPEGFDCPGCAWPDPKHTSSFEFCENGAKAVAWEATRKCADPALFAECTRSALRQQSDHWLEAQGRLTHPLRYDEGSDHFVPISWEQAYARIGAVLQGLDQPDQAAFYTSGRCSNEAAFLYQLYAREFGTNNLPDCSNLCHEASSVGLPLSIGVGKGTVTLEDFSQADLLLSFGHNPGSNHPRMLGTLREMARRGVPIIVFNPLRERGLERFRSPQHASEMLTGAATELASDYLQLRIGSDYRALQALMKRLIELDESGTPAIDHAFLAEHSVGYAALREQLLALEWPPLLAETGLTHADFDRIARLYAASKATIVAYGMGLTQHRHGTATVQQLANLLLLRGQIGKPGAGICPVRGHSNVQGDRTVGINERPPPEFLDALEAEFGLPMPRRDGATVVEAIAAMQRGEIRTLIALGGNIAMAAPDPPATAAALERLDLFVGIQTKLNRSALTGAREVLILPCLARSDLDLQATGAQFVTVEDSMSMVHASRGAQTPVSNELRSEAAIVAGMAQATRPDSSIPWSDLVADYDRIRERISRVIPGFQDYNQRVRRPGGFHLPNAAAQRQWRTASGKAQLHCFPESGSSTQPAGALRLTTIRSHDQYNTTIYGLDDRYRGVRGCRDVVFLHSDDIAELGLADDARVDVLAVDATGAAIAGRVLRGHRVRAYAIARGCCAAYFPEATVLIGLDAHDPHSHTPAYKSVWVRVRAADSDLPALSQATLP